MKDDRVKQNRTAAEGELKRAEEAAKRAREVADFMRDLITNPPPTPPLLDLGLPGQRPGHNGVPLGVTEWSRLHGHPEALALMQQFAANAEFYETYAEAARTLLAPPDGPEMQVFL